MKMRITAGVLCALSMFIQSSCGFITFNTGSETTEDGASAVGTESTADTAETETADAEVTTVPSSTTALPSAPVPSPEALARERLKALPDRDFGGASVIVATTDGSTVCPSKTDSVVSAARTDAKKAVEEKYNTTVLTVVANEEELYNDARTAYNADMYYADVLAVPQSALGSFVCDGILANLISMPYLDLDSEYFNSRITAASTAGEAVYAVGGSACLNPDYLSCIYFNRTLAEECGLGNIYELVQNGEWTWDKLNEFSEIAAQHGDDIISHGTPFANQDFTDIASHSMGIDYMSNDLGTVPTIDYMTSDRSKIWTDVTDKLYTHMFGERTFTNKNASESIDMFTSGKMLFYTDRLYFMSWILDADVNWGILPLPKYDGNQEEYLTLTAPDSPVFCVIANTPSYENSGILLEALNAAAHGYTEDAYISRCMDHYLRDDASIHMLDIICDSASVDFPHMFASEFRYMKESTFGAVNRAVTSRTTLNIQYRNYRNTTNYWLSVRFKVYN